MKLSKTVAAHAACAAVIVGSMAMAQRGGDHGSRDRDQKAQQHGGQAMPEFHELHPLADAGFTEMDMSEAMGKWMEANKPAKSHKLLKKMEGRWTTTSRMFMPGMPENESKGYCTNELIFDGRFLKCDYRGSMNTGMGEMPFKGVGFLGYNTLRKQFEQVWMDSMSTGMSTANGSMGMDGASLTMIGTMDDPMTGEWGKPVKWHYRLVNDDRYVFEAYEIGYGEPFKTFEIVYDRAN